MEMTALEKKWAEEATAHVPSLDDAYDKEGSLIVDKIEQKVMDRIPTPTGWRIVILPYRGAEKPKVALFCQIRPASVSKRLRFVAMCCLLVLLPMPMRLNSLPVRGARRVIGLSLVDMRAHACRLTRGRSESSMMTKFWLLSRILKTLFTYKALYGK